MRLACSDCDRNDYDGITEAELEALKHTWEGIVRVQSYAQSLRTIPPEEASDAPGQSVLDWYTHIGCCPECQTAQDTNWKERHL